MCCWPSGDVVDFVQMYWSCMSLLISTYDVYLFRKTIPKTSFWSWMTWEGKQWTDNNSMKYWNVVNKNIIKHTYQFIFIRIRSFSCDVHRMSNEIGEKIKYIETTLSRYPSPIQSEMRHTFFLLKIHFYSNLSIPIPLCPLSLSLFLSSNLSLSPPPLSRCSNFYTFMNCINALESDLSSFSSVFFNSKRTVLVSTATKAIISDD